MAERDFAWLAHRLRCSGIPAPRIRRTVSELHAHWLALVDEQVSCGALPSEARDRASQRLGADEELLKGVLQQPELRGWGARWPWICAIAPGLLLVMAELLVFASLGGLLFLLHHVVVPISAGHRVLAEPLLGRLVEVYRLLLLFVLPLAASVLLSAYAVRRRLHMVWPSAGLSVITALAAMLHFAAHPPGPGAPHGAVGGGLWISPGLGGLEHFGLRWLPFLAVSLLFYLWWQRAAKVEAHGGPRPNETSG